MRRLYSKRVIQHDHIVPVLITDFILEKHKRFSRQWEIYEAARRKRQGGFSMQWKYIRCAHCGKILVAWIGNGCIEIKNGNRHAVICMGGDGYADIACDRCGARNIIANFPQGFIPGESDVSVGAGKPFKERVEE